MILKYSEFLESLDNELLKTLAKIHQKRTTPDENYEDFFLDLIEDWGFTFYVNRNDYIIHIILKNMIDISNIESKVDKISKRLDSTVKRMESSFSTMCDYKIKLNGLPQSELDIHRHRYFYKFKGIGDNYYGVDKEGSYTKNNWPENKVSVQIDFYIS